MTTTSEQTWERGSAKARPYVWDTGHQAARPGVQIIEGPHWIWVPLEQAYALADA